MNTEDTIREILSKICSLHGKHANVEINKNSQLNISACCHEFREQMESIIKDFQKRGEDTSIAASFKRDIVRTV